MIRLAKATFGALALVVGALGLSAPAQARSDVGIHFSVGPAYASPCYRPYYARPAFCDYPVYRGPVYFDRWYDGPFRYRDYRGHRQYWHRGGWRHEGRPHRHGRRR